MFEVQTHTLCDGWMNTWKVGDKPQVFATHAEAAQELEDFLAEQHEAFLRGDLSSDAEPEQYRIVDAEEGSD